MSLTIKITRDIVSESELYTKLGVDLTAEALLRLIISHQQAFLSKAFPFPFPRTNQHKEMFSKTCERRCHVFVMIFSSTKIHPASLSPIPPPSTSLRLPHSISWDQERFISLKFSSCRTISCSCIERLVRPSPNRLGGRR